jgi:Flp pilus assembly pilin Flp
MRTIGTSESAPRRTLRERGQSTVEYVGLAVAVAVLLVAIGGGMGGHGDKLGGAVAKRLQEAIGATR